MIDDRYNALLPLSAKHLLLPRIGRRMTAFVRYCLEPKETWLPYIDDGLRKRGWPRETYFMGLICKEDLAFSLAFGFIAIGFEDGFTPALGYRQDLNSVLVWEDGSGGPALRAEPNTYTIDAADPRYSRKKFADLVGCTIKKISLFRSRKITETARSPNQIGLGFSFNESGGFVFGCGLQEDHCLTTILGYDDITPSARPLLTEVPVVPEASFE